jgi:hypothetical protein
MQAAKTIICQAKRSKPQFFNLNEIPMPKRNLQPIKASLLTWEAPIARIECNVHMTKITMTKPTKDRNSSRILIIKDHSLTEQIENQHHIEIVLWNWLKLKRPTQKLQRKEEYKHQRRADQS